MVIKGRSRSNGAQLANYLLNNKDNDRAQILEVRGTTTPDDLRRSLVEMSLSSQLTQRGEKGLYHAQINPAIGEDRPMTEADWLRAADILEESLGLADQHRAIVLHEKEGRIHGHVVWERYDHESGKLRTDSKNYEKHDQARAQIEQELQHERTPQRAERDPTDKERLTQLWQQHTDALDFVEAAQEAGYYIAQGNSRRPFRVVTPDGQSLNLVKQLETANTKQVRDRLQPIRAELPTEVQALAQYNRQPDREPERADNSWELSDSQNLMNAMKDYHNQQVELEQAPFKGYSFSVKIEQPPALPRQPDEKTPSDNERELSEIRSQAAEILERYQRRQAAEQERQRKAREMQQQAAELAKQRQQEQSITDQAAEMLERFRQRQRDQGRDGPEY